MKSLLCIAMMFFFLFSAVCAGDVVNKKEKYVKRNAENPEIAIETDFGTMKLELFHDLAPGHADSMLARAKDGSLVAVLRTGPDEKEFKSFSDHWRRITTARSEDNGKTLFRPPARGLKEAISKDLDFLF